MAKILINTKDGTVCTLEDTVIVDTEKLDDAGKELLKDWDECGSDGTACELGEKYGTSLEKFTDNDLTYANTIAFSAKALRDEINDRLENGYDKVAEYRMAKDFTDEQFAELGQYILSSDYIWTVFNEELREGIRNYAQDIMGKSI